MTARPIFNANLPTAVITDLGIIQWDFINARPVDYQGYAATLYQNALAAYGMTVPDPYVAPAAPAPASVTITFLQFLALFSTSEQLAIASSTIPQVQLFVIMASGSGGIQLNDPRVVAAINMLPTFGLIASYRVGQILSGAIPS